MSNEINSYDTNLCIAEDAFEKFQAVSTCEEDDFITLSDILPPPSPEHNPVSELDDVPYDNEVVLPAFLEQSQQETSGASAPCIQNSDVNTTAVAEPEVGVSALQSAETFDKPALPIINHEKPRKGRKKRASIATATSHTSNTDNVVNKNENSELTPGSVRPRRGRKPRIILDASFNSSTENNQQIVNPSKRGRGRPKMNKQKSSKKESLEREEMEHINSQNGLYAEINNDQTELSDASPNIIKKTPTRHSAQKRHGSILADEDNSTEDVTNLKTDSRLQKSGGKVSRRTHNKKKVVQKTESDDDEDEKSLSQIKKDGPKINGDEGLKMEVPISKVIPQELIVESQFIHNPHEQDENFSTLLNDTVGTNQMLLDSVDSEIVLENTDMEIDIVGTEETKFFPIIPNTNLPENEDFEFKIESENKIEHIESKKQNECDDNNLLVEDKTKRPVRRKARKTFQYDEGSDEDPFANVELSDDDEPTHRKKGRKYYSDDEYVPGKKEKISSSELSDSDIDNHEGISKPKRKRGRMKSQNKSPRKKNQVEEKIKPDVATITPHTVAEDDIEECLQTSVIKAPDEFKDKTSHNSEFENFIAKKIHGTELQIKKVSTSEPLQNTPLEIPVLDPNDIKKTAESSTQTSSVKMETAGVQTTTPYDAPMKKNITLSNKQSEKACEFLRNVVKTTAELGQLMTQKSEDFVTKKINTDYVTDTLKMDYCIRKSFLLFKLAKHNLMQMEEDLSKQYDEFLKENNLESCREKPKEVVAKPKTPDSDSDCEIVEETKPSTTKQTSKFNPKTVFLNKELSIKIAKKPSVPVNKALKKELNIKERHSVWINDSVMVKKVKPTQSFLAQDSRNKKPPDTYVTEKMVSDFFEEYMQKQVQQTCVAFTSTEWIIPFRTSVYSYYFVKSESFSDTDENYSENDSSKTSKHNGSNSNVGNKLSLATTANIVDTENSEPESLSALCTKTLQKILQDSDTNDHLPLIKNGYAIENKALIEETQNPRSLLQLCVKSLLQGLNYYNVLNHNPSLSNGYSLNGSTKVLFNVLSLKNICSSKIIEMFSTSLVGTEKTLSVISPRYSEYEDSVSSEISEIIYEDEEFANVSAENKVKSLFSLCVEWIQKHQQLHKIIHTNAVACFNPDHLKHISAENKVKSLFSLCVEWIQKHQQPHKIIHTNAVACFNPDHLKHIAFQTVMFLMHKNSTINIDNGLYFNNTVRMTPVKYKVKRLADICYEMISKFVNDENGERCNESVKLTINSVNTLSEEAFHNIDESCLNTEDNCQFSEEDGEINYYDENTFEDSNTNNYEEESQQTEECFKEDVWVSKLQMKELMSCLANEKNTNVNQNFTNDECSNNSEEQPMIAHIKIEPEEEIAENLLEPAIVKTEPLQNLDEMTVIPDGVVTKQENEELSQVDPIASGQENLRRESFDMSTFEHFVQNNKMMHAGEYAGTVDEIFSQSGLRVRRQYEPDSDNENIENDPNDLLVPQTFEPLTIETAKGRLMESSSDEDSANKKASDKKKSEKRTRGRPKKLENKQQATKEKVVSATPPNEVARLTKRMREKIRQEEKKVESSDSDTETLPLSKKKDKTKPDTKKSDKNKITDEEIQCNNVDSTEQLEKVSPGNDNFPGFSAVDQNEITSYQKYVKFVYDKIMPNDGDVSAKGSNTEIIQTVSTSGEYATPLINPDEPIEMLECEPTIPIFEEEIVNTGQKKTRTSANKQKTKEKTIEAKIKQNVPECNNKQDNKEKTEDITPPYRERDGWKCYPISSNEIKLYQNVGISLEKLPESFVETYFRYQNISVACKEDEEVNRLTNLNTLKRSGNLKDSKVKQKTKGKEPGTQTNENVSDGSRAASPANSDRYDELTPSEDEANVDNEVPPPGPRQGTGENNMAKNLLMGESDSDAENKIKTEPNDESETPSDKSKKKKTSPKSKGVVKTMESPENLMLTADKMMNKELNLLHAPVVLDDKATVLASTPKSGPTTRQKHKAGSSKHSKQEFVKNDDDSSSEEEKQWVSTKEKLLKRMGKKDSALEDDAKRAKLVTEFIERRGEGSQKMRRGQRGRPRKLSSRALLEREKQLRVLSKEMMSEGDARQHAAKSQSYFKGRRNIRKVIDKKSLQRSTVIANMEEFERKCRLNQRQARLREILGCDEGVNVVVMNDELCLEYDFDEQQAAVSVHQFFTKVMKAHQYEGVKFMWDACFESLEKVESGHKGGGCILAHCMGLGKTLQVLALLHTVLTHPRVGIQRVLVCCPLSTVLNWVDEIHKWIGPVTDQIKVFELSKLKKTYERAYQLEDWYNGGGIFIIGYELFRSLSLLDPVLDDVRPTIVNKIRMALLDPGPDIVVCDEGHLLKNDCSVLAVAMSRVQTRRRIVLTGTPMQNNLREYYCMVNFVKPNLLGTYSEYSNRFENPIMNGQHRDSRGEDIKLMKQRTHILHKVLEGCLQRQEASVLYPYLPKKHEYTVFIALTQCQWDLYKHYMHNYANQSKQNVLKDFHMLQKIWTHPQVLHNFLVRWRENRIKEAADKVKPEKVEDDLAQEDLAASSAVDIKPDEAETWWLPYLDGGKMLDTLASSNKFVAVFRILDECVQLGDKVLIFSTSLITMDSLEFYLKKINKWSLGQEYYRLDGSVPAEVRQKWCREYNAENNHKTKLFLISTRAGCLGLNMVAANRVIILDTSWNPAHDIQSIFRVYRFGQKKDCYIYRLVALGTMEQKIYERSVTKQAIACRVVDEQQIDRHYNMAELTELYKYDEMGASVASGVATGVEDVALLRVARVAAVHAVHEHDSLLRGSSEQALEEHERVAAWMQFQQEQTHKQIQNHLTPMPPLVTRTYKPKKEESSAPQLLQPPEIKTEEQATPITCPPVPETKSKRRKKLAPKPEPKPLDMDDAIVQKIMNILTKHNYQQRQGAKEISELVASVRKIVAYGKVPPKLGLNQDLIQSIANVLLGRDSPPRMAPLTDVDATKLENASRRKQQYDNLREPEEILPSTSSSPDPVDGRRRRRAALAAKKQIDSLASGGVIDLDDDDWQGGSETDDAPETTSIEQAKQPKAKSKKAERNIVQTEKQLNSDINSIILSDDEDTPSRKNKKKNKNVDSEEIVPLHPSLLSNKNFIKIVAHTYLEGNPMLDEDAATLAAQYSTLKALKEYESTGRKIETGPIYDIAIKVLGRDILKKLNKSNPAIASTSAPSPSTPSVSTPSISKPDEIKKEPQDSGGSSSGRVKPKGLSELMAPAPVRSATPVVAPPVAPPTPPAPAPSPAPPPSRRRGRPSRTSLQATQPPAPAAPPAEPVVPVGLIKMAPPSQPAQPTAPTHAPPQPQPFEPPAREESILPDDDVIFSQPINTEAPPRKNSQPLILNSVLAAKKPTPVIVRKSMAPQIQISSGSIVRPQPAPLTNMAPMSVQTMAPMSMQIMTPMSVQNMAPQTMSQDTICLDSDEEESITPNLPTKRVALKSTTKRPAPLTTTTFRAEPQLAPAPQSQPGAFPPNCIVIPASEFQKMRKLPMGMFPLNQNVQLINQFQPNVIEQQNMMQQSYMSHNMNRATSAPQNVNTMGTQYHNVLNAQTLNYTQVPAQSAPLVSTPHSMPLMNSLPQVSPAQSSPQSILPTPSEPAPTTPQQMSQLNKTVCKPGDILRITETGQVEILNREERPIAVDKPAEAAPVKGIAKKSTTKPPFAKKAAPSAIVNLDEDNEKSKKSYSKEKNAYKRSRKISSSSSSSSESSRASSPERHNEDPLSILKDVVHIRAADDECSAPKKSQTPSKPQNIGNVSITKSTATPRKPSSAPVKGSYTITPTKDKVMSLINQTDSMLKQLNSVLSSDKKSSKSKVDSKSHKVLDSVDLTDVDAPSTSSSQNKLSRNITVLPPGKATTKASSASKTSILKTRLSSTTTTPGGLSATKVVGKSSNIILKNSGGKKQVMVMNERKPAAPLVPKRAAPAPAPPPAAKKKKNEPMTLKDFDIDDIDDIIELD